MQGFEFESFLSDNLTGIGVSVFLFVALFGMYRRKRHETAGKKILQKTIATQTHEPISLHPEIDPAKCAGCGSCVVACPEGEIIKLIQHKAVLVSPTKCVGHGECEAACPYGAISLVFGTKTRGMDIPRISSNYETNVPGLYIAGELGGMGLIRNAVKQGAIASLHACKNIKASSETVDTDILVIGAGPAGISASLAAIEQKRSHLCIEQNSFGGTVFNFPRQKIVMTVPAELPIAGVMKFKQNKVSKEDLLAYWEDLKNKNQIKIKEHTRFDSLEKKGDIFEVKTNQGILRAKKVILALGVRGSPRRLGLENEDLPKVTYNLIDPEQYQNQSIAVVGGGNAGVEAAQYLGNPKYKNQVTLLVRGESFDRCNDENKKIIEEMQKKDQVTIHFNSSVKEIHPNKLVLTKQAQDFEIQNGFLFVFAGAEMPHKFLMSLGIQIEKKFAEKLK